MTETMEGSYLKRTKSLKATDYTIATVRPRDGFMLAAP